jgi:DNA-binding response OmpR family regulator
MAHKVLIADDEPSIVASLEFLMRQDGHDIRVAVNGDEVLGLVEEFGPDLVILDVMMPRRSGFEVCEKIREQESGRSIKILMLSARGREAEVSKGLALGADAYLTKPFSSRELLEVARQLLGEDRSPGDG